jgi:hypothetical protein
MYYYSLFLLFAIVAVVMTTDPNVAEYIDLIFRYSRNKLFVYKWWLFNNPKNPIVKYLIWRRSMKMAKEIQKELFEKSKKDLDSKE